MPGWQPSRLSLLLGSAAALAPKSCISHPSTHPHQRPLPLPSLSFITCLPCSGIYFPAMGEQVVKMVGLALVVIFGSAMDIAAIQQDTPKARWPVLPCCACCPAVAAPACTCSCAVLGTAPAACPACFCGRKHSGFTPCAAPTNTPCNWPDHFACRRRLISIASW